METAAPPEPDRRPGAPHPAETRALHGQGAAVAAVEAALAAGRMHHAWLLRGPEGVGKATLAYGVARRAIAGGGPLAMPEHDPVARRIRAGSEPRLMVLRRGLNPKTGRLRAQIGVDEVRALRRFLGLTAANGGWRAVIVDSADEMTASAANALLKLLEEPPAETLFLLVSHAPGRLLPTIRSRCRTLDLAPLSPKDLAAALAGAGAPVPEDGAAALAELAGGSVGQALALIAGDGLALYAALVDLVSGGRVDRSALSALAERASGRDRETLSPVLARLTLLLLGRLARAGAAGAPTHPAAPGEGRLFAELARTPAQARLWAEAASEAASRLRHAQAVNLDPGQTILDIYLALEGTVDRARAAP